VCERERDRQAEVRQGDRGRGTEDTYLLLIRERGKERREGQAGRGEAGREREGRTGATLTIY
jgi:hypothetical protein